MGTPSLVNSRSNITSSEFYSRLSIAFAALLESFPDYQEFNYRVAGRVVRLQFASKSLIPLLTPALSHLSIETCCPPELTIRISDFTGNNGQMPSVPDAISPTSPLQVFDDARFKVDYHERTQRLYAYDATEQTAFFLVGDINRLSHQDRSAPFVKILRWWMRQFQTALAHGAVVGIEGQGILIPGQGGSGKSTTAINCLLAGMSYLSDDYFLISAEEEVTAHGIYCTAKLNCQESALDDRIAAWSGIRDNDSEKNLYFLNQSHSLQLVSTMRLQGVLVIEFCNDSNSSLVPTSPNSALRELAPSSLFQVSGTKSSDFAILAKAVNSLPCYILKAGNNRSKVASTIRSFFGRENIYIRQ